MNADELATALDRQRSPLNMPIRRWDRSMRQPTVGQLVLWCVDRGLDLSEVRVTGSEISWEDVETDAERDKRLARWEAADRARSERDRRTFDVNTNPMEEQWPTRTQTTV